MIELFGNLPKNVFKKGRLYNDYFNRKGILRGNPYFRDNSIKKKISKEREITERENNDIEEFLVLFFEYDKDKRNSMEDILSRNIWYNTY